MLHLAIYELHLGTEKLRCARYFFTDQGLAGYSIFLTVLNLGRFVGASEMLDDVEQLRFHVFHIPMKGCEKMSQIIINLPYEDKRKFAEIAYKNDITMSQLLRWFIRDINNTSQYGITLRIENKRGEF